MTDESTENPDQRPVPTAEEKADAQLLTDAIAANLKARELCLETEIALIAAGRKYALKYGSEQMPLYLEQVDANHAQMEALNEPHHNLLGAMCDDVDMEGGEGGKG